MSITLVTNPCRVSLSQDFFNLYSNHLKLNAKYGFNATLLYSAGNDFFEPWAFASWYCQNSNEEPLIALNPLFTHPYIAAWKILSLYTLYKRKISINWITGASKSDFAKLGDTLPKEQRFARLKEHFFVVKHLLHDKTPLTFSGNFYQLNGAFLGERVDEVNIKHFIAGESELSTDTAMELNIRQLKMLNNDYGMQAKKERNLCFGLLLEETNQLAQEKVNRIFSNNSLGEKYFELGVQNSDSTWKQRLYQDSKQITQTNYNTKPIKKFAEAPFFVGSFAEGLAFFEELKLNGVETLVVVLAREKDYEALAKIRNELETK